MANPFPIPPPPSPRTTTTPRQQIRPVPQLTLPQTGSSLKAPPPPPVSSSNRNKPKDKGLLGGAISSVGQILSFPKTIAGMLPTLIGKTAQTAVGIPDLIAGSALTGYESRFEKDISKAKELGLTGIDAAAYSFNRQLPLVGGLVESVPRTAGRLAETAALGFYNYGDPGWDYYNALRQGQLGNVLIEDAGNVLLVGRGLGLGSLAEAGGAAVGGRVGSAIKGAGSFVEQPIAATVRGTARGVKLGAEYGGKTELAAAAGRIAESGLPFKPNLVERWNKRFKGIEIPKREPGVGPVRRTLEEVIKAKRGYADVQLAEFDSQIAAINNEMDALRANDPDDLALNFKAGELAKLNEKRMTWLERTGKPKELRKFERVRERIYTQYRDKFSSDFVRIQDLGPVPETVQRLRAQVVELRQAAGLENDPIQATRMNQLANFIERKANVKEANPGQLDQPLPDWVGAAGILHITGQIRDVQAALRAGKSLQQILDDLQPYDLPPELKDLGYSYSIESLTKALQYLNRSIDDVSSIQLEAFMQTYAGWHNFFNDMAMTGKGFLKGPMPFTYQDVYPDPSLLIEELQGRTISPEVQEVLDTAVVYVIERDAPELKDTLGDLDVNDPPAKIFAKFANTPIDSLEYQIAAQAIIESFDYLRNSDNIAVVEFLRNKMIYPAPMRPSLGLQEQFAQTARANDVASMARSLQYIGTEYADLFNSRLLEAIDRDIAAALDANLRFDKETWMTLGKRLETVKKRAQQIIDSAETNQAKLGTAVQSADTRLIDVINTIEDAQRLIDTIKNDPEGAFGLTPEQSVLSGVQEDIAKNEQRQRILRNLEESRSIRDLRRLGGKIPKERQLVQSALTEVVTPEGTFPIREYIQKLVRRVSGLEGADTRGLNAVERIQLQISRLRKKQSLAATLDQNGLLEVVDQLRNAEETYGPAKTFRTQEELLFEGRDGGEYFPEYYKDIIEAYAYPEQFEARINALENQVPKLVSETERAAVERANQISDLRRQINELEDLSQNKYQYPDQVLSDKAKKARARGDIVEADRLDRLARIYRNALTNRGYLDPYLNQLQINLRALEKGLPARTREAATSVRVQVRERLKGVGKIETATNTFETLDNEGNVVRLTGTNPNANDVVMTSTTSARLFGERDRIIADQAKLTTRMEELRDKHAKADELAARVDAGETAASRYEAQLRQPFGPEIQPEAPMYVPGGVTSSMSDAARVRLAEVATGAEPQMGAAYERVKFSNLMPLSVTQVAERISEVMGQWGRNSVIEDIIKNPEFVKSVAKTIPEGELSILKTNAENNVRNVGKAQTSQQFAAAVRKEYGKLIMDRLRNEGLEPISPTQVDPMSTVGHAPLGDLSQKVNPENVAENTLVMQIGMRDRIAGQYKPKFGGNDIPQSVIKTFLKVGKVTQKWKSVILPFSIVRWQMGDAVGNVLNAWVRGDIPPGELIRSINDVKRRLQDPQNLSTLQLLFSDTTNRAISDPVLAAGIGLGAQARGLRSTETAGLRRGTLRPSPKYVPSRYFGNFRDAMFNLNETQNTLARGGVLLYKLDETLKKMGRSIDEISTETVAADPILYQAVTDAVAFTNDTLGAFSELSPWERNVLRQAFPFWSWIKYINKAAMKLVIDNPDRVLFYAHLGAIVADPNQKDFYDWLRGKTPIGGFLFDLSFTNPYEDALLYSGNPLAATAEQFTSLSPAITFPLNAINETVYATSGRNLIPFSPITRPGYLEGRPNASTRGIGDVLGGIGYMGLKSFGGPFRNILSVLPTGTIPGTDVATGPVNRYPQGSARTTGAYSDPRLSPTAGRLSAVLSTFGIPAPIFEYDEAIRQGKLQGQRDRAALLRRIQERAGIS